MRWIPCGVFAISLAGAACAPSPTMPSAVVPLGALPAAPSGTPRYVPPPGPSSAVVRVSKFTVVQSPARQGFNLIPIVQLTEDSGASAAWITGAVFTYLDSGSPGRIPEVPLGGYLPAGGTLDFLKLVANAYGDPDLEFSNSINARRVGVTITFADNEGRVGSVSAATDVDR